MEPSSPNIGFRASGRCDPVRNPFSVPQENHSHCPWDAPCHAVTRRGRQRREDADCLHPDGPPVHESIPRFPEKLCQAIEKNDMEFCRYFLSQNIDWDSILHRDPRGRYPSTQLPLHTMFLTRSTSLDGPVLQLLLASGIDLNLRDSFGRSALHCVMNRIHSERSHSLPACKYSFDFYEAVRCAETLIRGGADVNCRDGSRQTPLHLAAFYNLPPCVSPLIQLGADTDVRDINGNTPLHVCAMFSHSETLAALLNNNANPNIGNSIGERPLHMASRNYAHTSLPCVKLLLTSVDDINQRDNDDNTPLHLAVSNCIREDIITRLVSRGADPDLINAQGQSALFLYLSNKLVEKQHRPVLRPSRFQDRIQLPDLGKCIQHSAGFCLLMDHSTYIRITDRGGNYPRLLLKPETCGLRIWLLRLARTPRSLAFLCRQAVRRALRPFRLNWEICRRLELPRGLMEYIVTPLYKRDTFAPWLTSTEDSDTEEDD